MTLTPQIVGRWIFFAAWPPVMHRLRSRTHDGLGLGGLGLVLPLALLVVLATEGSAAESNRFAEFIAPAMQKHCVICHGKEGEVEAGVNLLELESENLAGSVELIGRVIEVLDLKEMPPEDAPQLDEEERRNLVTELKAILRASHSRQRAFAPTPIRRMNRFQYNNAVVDLFDLNCIVFTLPERMMRNTKDIFDPRRERWCKWLRSAVVRWGNRS